ncbi:hypothetical protein [Aliiglaciecola litoralis]|uniref:Uncharacterized protein n=1 Tax=Aliiglaciecola litoralis TaxID=582857 RepID=A0ABN1LBN7_9ALTE
MDSLIFKFHRSTISDEKLDTSQQVDNFALFAASPNESTFKSKKYKMNLTDSWRYSSLAANINKPLTTKIKTLTFIIAKNKDTHF